MIDEPALLDRVRQIREIAARHGGTVIFDLPSPAQATDTETCEAFFDSPLPPSLKDFWARHNGMSIQIYAPEYPPETLLPAFMLTVRSTTTVITSSGSLREYFADMRHLGEDAFTDAEARRYLDFAAFGDSSRLTLLDLGRIDPTSGEAPIIDVNNDDWFNVELTPIAWSLDDFIIRCVDFMIETECGFRYWYGTEGGW